MSISVWPSAGRAPREPWFQQHPNLALGVAGVLYLTVLCLRLFAGSPVDAYSMLYAFPVALVATATGLRGGALAGLLAVALIALWTELDDVSLSLPGWSSRVLPLLLLGVLIGHATERVRRAEADRVRLEDAALLHRQAIEINDSLVQGMAAAKWSLESGRVETGKEILDVTLTEAQRLVSGLIRRAGTGERSVAIDDAEVPNAPTR